MGGRRAKGHGKSEGEERGGEGRNQFRIKLPAMNLPPLRLRSSFSSFYIGYVDDAEGHRPLLVGDAMPRRTAITFQDGDASMVSELANYQGTKGLSFAGQAAAVLRC